MKKKLFSIILLALVAVTCVMSFASCKKQEVVENKEEVKVENTECQHDLGSLVAAVTETCATDGAVAHYKCSKCGKYFDTKKSELASIKIERKDHTYDHPFDLFCNLCNARKDPSLEITDIQIVGDGEFVLITYANGTTSIPDEFANCSHSNDSLFLTLKEHTATVKGRYIYRCNVCSLFKLKEAFAHDTEGAPSVVNPTCTTAGSTTATCSICSKTVGEPVAIPALGHDPNADEARIVLDPGKNICVDGAIAFNYCNRCETTFKEIINPKEENGYDGYHTVLVWDLIVAPTTTNTGLLSAVCTEDHCGAVCEYVLPVIDNSNYTIVHNAPTIGCGTENTAVATFNAVGGYSFNVNGSIKNSLKFDIVTEIHPHTFIIDGEYFVPMDLSEVYDLTSGNFKVYNPADGLFYANNTDADGNQIVYCYTENAKGCFNCTECGLDVEISLKLPHIVDSWVEDPTVGCTDDVIYHGSCNYVNADGTPCGAILTKTEAARGHDFDYTLTYVKDGLNYIYTVNGVCTAPGCGETIILEDADIHANVTVVPYVANCGASGTTIHSIVIDGNTVIVEEAVEKLSHVIIGYTITDTDSPLNIKLYPRLGVGNSVLCSEDKYVEFTCDACGDAVTLLLHKDHTPATANGVITATPDCETPGIETFACRYCVDTTFDIEIAPTGHVIENATKVELVEDSTYLIFGSCSICDEEVSVTAELTYDAGNSVTPTCTATGRDVYVYENGDTIVINLPAKPHTLRGNLMNAENDVYVYVYGCGLEVFADNPVNSCSTSVVVSYKCDVCRGYVLTNAVAPHAFTDDGDVTNDTLPTCDSEGVKVGHCADCGPDVVLTERIAKLDHVLAYQYSLTQKILIVTCDREGCSHRVVLERTTRVITPSTCQTNGNVVYRGLDENGASKTYTEILAKAPHSTDLLSIIDGAYPIVEGKSGTYSGTDLACEQVVRGFYVCVDCNVKVHCDVYQPHTPTTNSKIVLKAPTCTEVGYYGFICKFCEDVNADNLEGVFSEIKEVIPAKKHNVAASLVTIPGAESFGIVTAYCTESGCGFEKEYMIPTLTSGEYDITVVTLPTCFDTGVDNYRYVLNLGDDIRSPEFTVSFNIDTPVYEYVEGESREFVVINTESVTFLDPFDVAITESIMVTYVFYRCDNDDCDVHQLIAKSFKYDGNDYVFNFETLEFELIVPDGEIEFTEEELNPLA